MAASSDQEGYEIFLKELNDIDNAKEQGEEEEELLSKTPDEGEIEAEWLKSAGYGFVVNKLQEGKDLSDDELEALTSSLTRKQAQAVQRRVDTLSTTMRKRQKANQKVHVKDIFNNPDEQGQTPMVQDPPSSPDVISNQPPLISRVSGGGKGRDRPFLKLGNYSMSGLNTLEVQDYLDTGVKAISFKPRNTFGKKKDGLDGRGVMLPVISDAEISDFHIQEVQSANRVELPVFETKPHTSGTIKIGDISSEDMIKIRSLALIELTALFDSCNITYSKFKRKIKSKDHGLFGVPLQSLVEQDQKRGSTSQVPLIFSMLISHLENDGITSEGILRVPGAVTRVKQLRHDLNEKFYSGHFRWEEFLPHDAAAIMKQFLRELPVPLLTYDYLDAFPQIEHLKSSYEKLNALNLLILLLPDSHRDSLKLLLRFLRNIVSHSNENKMGLNNVAMIMAPNLFLAPTSRSKTKTVEEVELNRAAGTSKIITMLIHYQDILWTIPPSFIDQVRHQYEVDQKAKSRENRIKRFLKKDKGEAYKRSSSQEPEPQEGVIRVQAPHLTKSSALIQLDDRMTAADVVAPFKRQAGSHDKPNSNHHGYKPLPPRFRNPDNAQFAEDNAYLFEVGGNIGERCIDPKANILDIYKTNPHAEWIIKVKYDR
ncbi:hypothetical protein SNE40_021597 [Patella caerulea]|uniref:Rho-GAP domain-containing protein n=1 Tax=Patella caerulea TaxID=87958 RepID=A0AAN8IZ88_PATCE